MSLTEESLLPQASPAAVDEVPSSSRPFPRLCYEDKMILAPMVKIGTLPSRLLAIEMGADIVYTEEIIDFRILRSERVENRILDTVDYVDRTDDTLVLRISPLERGKLVLQIGTCDAKRAERVAKIVERDVDGIDVNMGCPKSFSLKGGMGAALLTQPDKIRDILTSLVKAVRIPITCKIRILPKLEDTLKLVKVIETCGVAALAVHGRTKEERPNDENHIDIIQEVVKNCKLPVIANGGSSNNRNSLANTHDGILNFWRSSGASSVMVARAAEWNPSVFRKEGKLEIMEVVDKYLDLAIDFDYTFIIVKYNVQQILGSEQDSEMGRKFLASSTMRDLCVILGKEETWLKRQECLRQQAAKFSTVATSLRYSREAVLVPRKRKLSDSEGEVTEMFCPFVRGHFTDCREIPKVCLLEWTRVQGKEKPVYSTVQTDKTFRSIVIVDGDRFSSESWEKNKKYSEQAAAMVALHCLGIKRVKQDNGSDDSRIAEKCS